MAVKRFEVALPEEVLKGFGLQDEADEQLPRRVLEALVMELLRLDRLSEWEAQQVLKIDNLWDLYETMGRYEVPAVRMTPEEMKEEFKRWDTRKQQ